MKKSKSFKVGDKVFAKVKGYPPWPAHIIAENGKKYNVKFYGTGETGMIKVEDVFYYVKNKEKFQKPLKRKDYLDAIEQIEQAVKEAGGDGNLEDADDTISSESNVSMNHSANSSLNTSAVKSGKKGMKRNRSVSDKSNTESVTTPKKRASRAGKSEEVFVVEAEENTKDEPKLPLKDAGKTKEEASQSQNAKEFEFVQINDAVGCTSEGEGIEIIEKQEGREKVETLDFKIEVVSERTLKTNMAYAKFVKEKESIYKGRPVEPREDFISQVLPVKLSSGIVGGIKLHTEWPLNFTTEYERALYDEAVAARVLEDKQKILSGDARITSNHQLFIPNIEMSMDEVKESIYIKDIDLKKAKILRLKVESELVGLDTKIKSCLGLDKAEPRQAIGYLESICDINFDDLMLKKHPHVVEMVRRLRKYVGNTKEWNLSEDSLNEFSGLAEKVRAKAEIVYAKFKTVVKVPETATSFWEGFMDLVSQFRTDCKEMTEAQIYVLCSEPTSRQFFFDQLDEVESEKENSSGVANSEPEHAAKNGTAETQPGES